jgi:hypothetical protein
VPPRSPVPDHVATELRRVVQRWQQLPLDSASSCLPAVHAVLTELAEGLTVPDLGPAVVMDQLTVLVHDACAEGRWAGLDGRLADLRRTLP